MGALKTGHGGWTLDIAEILAKQTQSGKRTKSVCFYLKNGKKERKEIEQERMHENPLYYCVNMAKGGLTSKRNTAPSTTITITTKPYILLPLIYFVGTKIIQPTKIEANILIIQNLNQFD